MTEHRKSCSQAEQRAKAVETEEEVNMHSVRLKAVGTGEAYTDSVRRRVVGTEEANVHSVRPNAVETEEVNMNSMGMQAGVNTEHLRDHNSEPFQPQAYLVRAY
jgi:hypothetical protein